MTRMSRKHRGAIVTATLVVAAASTAAGCGGGGRFGRSATATPTPSGTATPRATPSGGVARVVTTDGALVLPVPPQPLGFSMVGEVLDVDVTEGQEVKTGDVLARMDLLPFDMAVSDATAALAQAEDALSKAEEGASAAEAASARAEVAASESALVKLESGADLETARLEMERAKNSLWGIQAQRDSICGAAERKFATQADCDAAQANVQAAEQGVQIAQQQYAAAKAALPQNLAAARARLESARAAQSKLYAGASATQLASLRARVEQARLALSAAEADRARAVLSAPFDGSVSAVHVAAGTRVGPGSPVVTLAKTSPLRFATNNLSERNIGDITEGADATVVLAAYPERRLHAKVQRVAPQAEADPTGAVVFTVYLDLDGEDLPLRAGMTGRAEIEAGAPAD